MFWTGTSPLNLVIAFDSPMGSVLKAWQLKRGMINKLSDAFASLEAAKARPQAGSSIDEEDDSNEDWMAEHTKSRTLERRKLCEAVVASHSDRILCVTVPWQQWPLSGDEMSTAVEQACVLDSLTLDIANDYEALKCKPAVQSRKSFFFRCSTGEWTETKAFDSGMTLSPNDVLVAAVTAEGRPSLLRSPTGMWASDSKGKLFNPPSVHATFGHRGLCKIPCSVLDLQDCSWSSRFCRRTTMAICRWCCKAPMSSRIRSNVLAWPSHPRLHSSSDSSNSGLLSMDADVAASSWS